MAGQRANACDARRDILTTSAGATIRTCLRVTYGISRFNAGYLPPWAQLSHHQRRVAFEVGMCNETDKYRNQIVAALENYLLKLGRAKQSSTRRNLVPSTRGGQLSLAWPAIPPSIKTSLNYPVVGLVQYCTVLSHNEHAR